MATIDLTRYTVSGGRPVLNLAGFEYGRNVRKNLNLSQLDRGPGPHVVLVPPYVDYISTGFFDGLFGESVDVLDSPAAFRRHYRFEASDLVMGDIDNGIARLYSQIAA